jgi:hypothetical protein
MKFIDFGESLNDYLTDEKRKIPQEHLESICKIKQQHETCKYIFLSPLGYVCMKNTPAKKELDRLAKTGQMTSRSDNCIGIEKI